MAIAGVNNWAVVVAAVVSFLFGGIWYGFFARQWLAALGKTEEELKSAGSVLTPMVIAFAAQLAMAWMLALFIVNLAAGHPTLSSGLLTGFLTWLGFVVTTQLVNDSFQMQRRTLTMIDTGHWLGVLLLQGAVIGIIGGR